MAIRASVLTKPLQFVEFRLPTWPTLNLGKHLGDIAQAYSNAFSTAQLAALGIETDSAASRERNRWDADY